MPIRADDADIVGRLCCASIEGRRAAKMLGALSKQLALTEPEFEILWCLRNAECGGMDQTTLAGRLVFSPAQVSACVEKLRVRGLIICHDVPGDRRRHLWALTGKATELLKQAVLAAGSAESTQPAPTQAEAAA
jgi:DNA-binding MarR family transcriptional regulator